ncbi:transcriptional regulator, y4mF family [Slackia exigua ATCC 700122]|uniref:Transcriptional regulator, y4mF family n=1 Tax=Slackia exigua (strain ATCC 700122 / DSM 15923 / CIP 105133 / JCM 11022 / KCTC 5966 / S-7) TaxID=649764 RepID=D0WGU7_SLAES|nr:transcriptional regulator, y4mF family [Slackia exigua ATCC 700122]STN99304.1 anaerobic benzoate catabolism transcriptional regulator [Slackia exigua]
MKVTTTEQLGSIVRNARAELGLTQSQLAAEAGVSRRLIAAVEDGSAANVGFGRVLAICSALGISMCLGEDLPSRPLPPAEERLSEKALLAGSAALEILGGGSR